MPRFDQQRFNKFILEEGIVSFGNELTLSSGRKSNWYVNWRPVLNDVFKCDKVADYVLAFIRDKGLKIDCFVGVSKGATKLGLIATYKLAIQSFDYGPDRYPLPMERAVPKEHGDPRDKYYVGAPRGNVCALEDVTTTGGSLCRTLDGLIQLPDVNVVAAVTLTHRMDVKVEDLIKQRYDIDFYWLSEGPLLLARMKKLTL